MSILKRVMAFALILVLCLGIAAAGIGEKSPGKVDDPKNPNWDDKTSTDTEHKSTHDTVIKVTGDKAQVIKVTRNPKSKNTVIVIRYSKNRDNKQVEVTEFGDGKKGVLNNKSGKKITGVVIKNKKTVTFNPNAFKGSKVTNVEVRGQKSKFKKNTFKGTQKTTVTIRLTGAKTLPNEIDLSEGVPEGCFVMEI